MSKISPLFSGSSGNSTYIGCQNGGILIDAGASFKGLSSALERAGGSYGEIKAVAITHEHIDHICGLKPFLNKTEAVLVASKQTLEALISADKIPAKTKIISIDKEAVEIDGILINRFATSHDCKGSSGYYVYLPDGKKVSVCTDLGVVTDEVRNAISKSDVLLIESNHDIDMLKKGPYPQSLKMRIMSETGHISNNACAAEIKELFKNGSMRFILGHLSRNNNTPILARAASEAALMDLGAQNGKDYILSVASPKENGVTII